MYTMFIFRAPANLLPNLLLEPFPKQQILDSSESKEFADDNYLIENGRKISEMAENAVGKKRNCS